MYVLLEFLTKGISLIDFVKQLSQNYPIISTLIYEYHRVQSRRPLGKKIMEVQVSMLILRYY